MLLASSTDAIAQYSKEKKEKEDEARIEREIIIGLDETDQTIDVDAVLESVNKTKDKSELHGRLGKAETARRLLYRSLTPFEHTIARKLPQEPIAILSRSVVLTYAATDNVDEKLNGLKRAKGVKYAERNQKLHRSAPVYPTESGSSGFFGSGATTPSANYGVTLGKQWGMHVMRFPEAWEKHTGYAHVGVVDSGIQWPLISGQRVPHEDLRANFRPHLSKNFTNNSTRFDEFDQIASDGTSPGSAGIGHGTHVAGIISANANNLASGVGTGVAGGCWGCSHNPKYGDRQ